MDQPEVTCKEPDVLDSLSDNFFNSLVIPIPSVSASEAAYNPSKIQQSQHKQDVAIAGLKSANYRSTYGFRSLAFGLTYKKFTIRLAELNPHTLTRPAAEKAWQALIRAKFKEWKPSPKLYSQEKKRRLLRDALDQVRGKGFNGFNVENFWRNWESIVPPGRREAEKKGNTKVRVRAKNHGMGRMEFKLELQLRPKPGIQSEQAIVPTPAAIPAVFQRELKEQDDKMKL